MNFEKIKDKLRDIFYIDVLHERRIIPFLIFISFLISFLVGRGFAFLFPERVVIIKGYHIHHFFYGIFFISVAGVTGLVSTALKKIKFAAVMFGIGLGLLADEIGLLFTCTSVAFECNYWSRLTYDFIVIVFLIYLAVMFFDPIWLKRKGKS